MPQKRSKSSLAAVNKNLEKRKNPGKSNASTNPDRFIKGMSGVGTTYRTKSTIKLLNLYNDKPDIDKMKEQKLKPARIEPDRKWFGNVRTVDPKTLDKYRAELAEYKKDPYNFLLKNKKVDYEIFTQDGKYKRNKLTDIESFADTFGPKMKRHKPKLYTNTVEELAAMAEEREEKYDVNKDGYLETKKEEAKILKKYNSDKRIEAGQSKRIWEELYKIIDSSDVLCIVLDARDPLGTKAVHAEKHLEKNCKLKHIIYILNKVDLVPTSITARWVKYLSQFHPTVAYKGDINKPFGRNALIKLLRQFDNFHKDKKTISVGFIGYPNVGKSTVINSLRKKAVCKAAPIAGETKVWQYVALTKRIYLIDSPGVVYSSDNDSEVDVVLKGVVRPERLDDAPYYIPAILERAQRGSIAQVYGIDDIIDGDDFLKKVASRSGRLLKGNEPDISSVAKMILNDWQRGHIPHFTIPPETKTEDN